MALLVSIPQSLWTPLHSAAYHGRVDATEVLVDAGADLMAVNEVSGLQYTPV